MADVWIQDYDTSCLVCFGLVTECGCEGCNRHICCRKSFIVTITFDDPHSTTLFSSFNLLPQLLSFAHFSHKALQINLSLNGCAIRSRCPVPDIDSVHVRTSNKQYSKRSQITIASSKMERRVTLCISSLDSSIRSARNVGEQQLQNTVMAAYASLHDGITTTDVSSEYYSIIILAQHSGNLDMTSSRSEHQRRLVAFVQGRTGVFMTSVEEYVAYFSMTLRSG